MTVWAITVKAPQTRRSLEAELQTFAQSLPDRPSHRAGNVLGYELFAANTGFWAEPVQYALLLATVDHGAEPALATLVKELNEKLLASFSEGLDVSGVELNSVEKSAAASR
jgi:hypothetical protein